MRFKFFGIQFIFLIKIPFVIAICNGRFIFNIPSLFTITNVNTIEDSVLVILDNESDQFKLDIGWDKFALILIKAGVVNINISFKWVQWLLGDKKTNCVVDYGTAKTYHTSCGEFTIYEATSDSRYSRLPFIKFNKQEGYTYTRLSPEKEFHDNRKLLAIISRVKCPTSQKACELISDMYRIMPIFARDVKQVIDIHKAEGRNV